MRKQILSFRPTIPSIENGKEVSRVEIFQNSTLRPILKFQNGLIMSIFKNYVDKYGVDLSEYSDAKRNEMIEKMILKDRNLSKFFLGIIIGHFSDQEWNDYLLNEREINRRINRLIIQRLQSQV